MKNKPIVQKIFILMILLIICLCIFDGTIQAKTETKQKSFRFAVTQTQSSYGELDGNCNFIDTNNIWVGLSFTEDGGKTWRRMVETTKIMNILGFEEREGRIGGGGPLDDKLTIFFLNKKRGWLIPGVDGDNSTWQTEDGGYTWLKIFDFKCYDRPFFLADKKHGWFFGMEKGMDYVIATKNGGRTWSKHKTQVPLHGRIAYPYFLNEKIGYAINVIEVGLDDSERPITIRGVVKTTDGGRNWQPRWMSTDHGEHYSGMYFIDEKEGWLWSCCGIDSIYHTTDGGTSWKKDSEYSGLRVPVGSMYFIDKNRGWLISAIFVDMNDGSGEIKPILKTIDGGKHWDIVHREEIIKNPELYFGSKPYFPNWNEGNMFLFRLKMGHSKETKP